MTLGSRSFTDVLKLVEVLGRAEFSDDWYLVREDVPEGVIDSEAVVPRTRCVALGHGTSSPLQPASGRSGASRASQGSPPMLVVIVVIP